MVQTLLGQRSTKTSKNIYAFIRYPPGISFSVIPMKKSAFIRALVLLNQFAYIAKIRVNKVQGKSGDTNIWIRHCSVIPHF